MSTGTRTVTPRSAAFASNRPFMAVPAPIRNATVAPIAAPQARTMTSPVVNGTPQSTQARGSARRAPTTMPIGREGADALRRLLRQHQHGGGRDQGVLELVAHLGAQGVDPVAGSVDELVCGLGEKTRNPNARP